MPVFDSQRRAKFKLTWDSIAWNSGSWVFIQFYIFFFRLEKNSDIALYFQIAKILQTKKSFQRSNFNPNHNYIGTTCGNSMKRKESRGAYLSFKRFFAILYHINPILSWIFLKYTIPVVWILGMKLDVFIIKGFQTIVFIVIVISTTFQPIYPPAFFRCLLSKFMRQIKMIFIIKGFRSIVFIFIVISTTFRPICPPAFLRYLSNSGTYKELRTTSWRGRRAYQTKHYGNNNKDEDNSLKTLNDNDIQ